MNRNIATPRVPLYEPDLHVRSVGGHDCRAMIPLQFVRELRLSDWAPRDEAHSTVVYSCFDQSGQRLYVGITLRSCIRARIGHHRRRPWWPDVTDLTILHCLSRREAAKLESTIIRRDRPTYNVAQKPRCG